MNKKYRHAIILVGLLMQINPLISQNLFIEYKGSASATNIIGNEEHYYNKASGGNISYACFTVPIPYSESIIHNCQTISNAIINSNIPYSNYAVINDQEGVPRVKIEYEGTNLTNFTLTRHYNASTTLNFPPECFEDDFPLTTPLPVAVQGYLSRTNLVQSDNQAIRNIAQSIVAGSVKMEDAVNKIAKWVVGNIGYTSTNPQDALTVYNRRAGNCKGFSHLTIALLRSVGIPARFAFVINLPYNYNIPYRTSQYIPMGQSGPAYHAVYEIYYPSLGNWVSGDGQGTVHFTVPNLIKFNHELDAENTEASMSITFSGIQPSISRGFNIASSIGSITSNYQYVKESAFGGSLAGILLSTHQDCLNTGLFDKVAIVSGPDLFKTGENVFYQAVFTSSDGTTYPVNWNWVIQLYHSGGTYVLSNKNDGTDLWATTTNPLLPAYDWLIDPLGKIYGEVVVTVGINDGDYKAATFPVSIEECNELHIANQTYTSNTTITGCYVTINNVSVQNNSSLIVNSEMGVTINGDFNVNVGSVFETSASGIVVVPTLAATSTVSGLTCNSATSGGNITFDGGAAVIERGVCWGTSVNPTIADSKVSNGSGTGSFTATLSPVLAGTTYYVRSYASNFAGTGYGTEVTYTQAITVPILEGTTAASSITHNSANSGGNVTSDGCGTVTARGICWATSQNPTTASSTTSNGSGTGTYTGNLTGLSANTTYYVRSYATNSAGTAYGAQTSFTTLAPPIVVPTLAATTTATSITQTTATSGGNVTSDGGATVSNRGICWSTSSSPTTANSTYTTGTGTGSFTAYLTGLSAGTTYYVRSFATNSVGTGYGSQISFTTPVAQVPSLAATAAVTNISATSATSGGNITSGNGSAVTARGVCWSTSSNPTIANSKTVDGSGDGTFMSSITGLSPNTLYYVRAYATNGVGTAYGSQVSFTSSSVVITASISYQVFSTQPTTIVIGWFANLTSPAPSGNTIPAIITNASGSGTHTANGSVAQGQASGIMIETVYYSRLAGSNYTATCGFGTMPAGYVAGATGSVTIPKQ